MADNNFLSVVSSLAAACMLKPVSVTVVVNGCPLKPDVKTEEY